MPAEYADLARTGAEQLEMCRADNRADWTYVTPAPLTEPGLRTGQYALGGATTCWSTRPGAHTSRWRTWPSRCWTSSRTQPTGVPASPSLTGPRFRRGVDASSTRAPAKVGRRASNGSPNGSAGPFRDHEPAPSSRRSGCVQDVPLRGEFPPRLQDQRGNGAHVIAVGAPM